MTAFQPGHFKDGESPVPLRARPVRVLVVDDSAVMRALLDQMFEPYADICIVARVGTAQQAFAFLEQQRVDIILLDHEMPGQKGLDALPQLVRMAVGAHIVMLSSHCPRGSKLAVKALSIGASDAILKPTWEQASPAFAASLADIFRRMTSPRYRQGMMAAEYSVRPFPARFRPGCIGIGASTGGIHALSALFGGGALRLGAPVLLTQHLPASFIASYAQQVARMTDMPVTVAGPDMLLRPDHIYIAPGDSSLSCTRADNGDAYSHLVPEHDRATLTRPSANIMMAGMAACYGANALGIVLTGIGRDGTIGASRIVDKGGVIIAQDAETSTVWGMPGSVVRAGLASAALPPAAMTAYLHLQTERKQTEEASCSKPD